MVKNFYHADLVKFVEKYGVHNLVFIMSVNEYVSNGKGLLFQSDKQVILNFRLTQNNYKVADNYKVQLYHRTTIDGIKFMYKETFYMMDLIKMIERGIIDICYEKPEGGFVTLVSNYKELVVDETPWYLKLIKRFLPVPNKVVL